jgi:hypothetical protein
MFPRRKLQVTCCMTSQAIQTSNGIVHAYSSIHTANAIILLIRKSPCGPNTWVNHAVLCRNLNKVDFLIRIMASGSQVGGGNLLIWSFLC